MRVFSISILISLLILSCKNKHPLFREVKGEKSGIHFNNQITEDDTLNVLHYEYIYNGGGVGIGDFNNDNLLEFTQTWFEGQYDVVEFQYIPRYEYWEKNRIEYTELNNYEKNRATLSWHLTQREKESLHKTILETNNQEALKKLKKLLE